LLGLGGVGGTGSVPILNLLGLGGVGGTGSVLILKLLGLGGVGGTGSVPIAINVEFPTVVAFPATARRTDTAVRTTSSAISNATTRFFI